MREPESARNSIDDHNFISEGQPTSPSAFIWALSVAAGISGILFGYDTGVISSTLVSIGPADLSHPLSTLDKSLITSSTSFFALIASPLAGILADRCGRKYVVLVSDVLFVVGALWQAWTVNVTGLVVGRSIIGLAVGGASLVVPLYVYLTCSRVVRSVLTLARQLHLGTRSISISWDACDPEHTLYHWRSSGRLRTRICSCSKSSRLAMDGWPRSNARRLPVRLATDAARDSAMACKGRSRKRSSRGSYESLRLGYEHDS